MMKRSVIWAGCLALLLVGCASHGKKKLSYADYPVHVYDQPFDLVFKTAFDVLSTQEGWIMNPTDKTEGTITMTSTTYANWWADLDNQKAQFIVKHVNRKQTSLEFDPAHSTCRDYRCHVLLEKVDHVLSELPAHVEVPKQQS